VREGSSDTLSSGGILLYGQVMRDQSEGLHCKRKWHGRYFRTIKKTKATASLI